MAALAWMAIEWVRFGKPTALGAATGAVAGLVASRPHPDSWVRCPPSSSAPIVSCVCFIAVNMKNRFGYDDTLGRVRVHCVGGAWGALATGLFASLGARACLRQGQPARRTGGRRRGGVIFADGNDLLIAKILDATIGLRVNAEHETVGLDQSQHGESGYEMFEAGRAIAATAIARSDSTTRRGHTYRVRLRRK